MYGSGGRNDDQGRRLVIELAGLEPFVANSHGSRHKLGTAVEEHVRAFGHEQKDTLAKSMEPKAITLCQDETFHPEVCLVAMEPVSNFIVLEKYSEARDADSWSDAIVDALEGLPVHVVQSTSDEGKGLLSHVRGALEAHHSPDISHVQQELSRATSIALSSQIRRAEEAVAEAAVQAEVRRTDAANWAQTAHGPGRPPAFASRIEAADAHKAAAEKALEAARLRKERTARAIRAIGTTYHPVDLTTGELQSAETVAEALELHFADVFVVAEEAALPERSFKGIRKAHRLVPDLQSTVRFFHGHLRDQLDALGLSAEERQEVEQHLVPAAYLDRAARKATAAETRTALRSLATEVRCAPDTVLDDISQERRAAIDRVVKRCADLFQRSSSCVEGRNGQLSLRHHSLHNISAKRLEALTVVHNYVIRCPDGTAAATRFFGAQHANLFESLLAHIAMPARPVASRSRHAKTLVLN